MEHHKIKIDKGQFGAINDWMMIGALKNHVQIMLLDYAKAFDHINLNILMKKISDLSITHILLCWIE